jgi:ABC-2 type transport system permease protein
MSTESGVIHDIGYQRYAGERLGRGAVVRALFVHSLRAAFGLGRSAKAKIFPWPVAGIVLGTAFVLVAYRLFTKEVALTYVQFDDVMSWLVIFFVAIVAPEIVSRDLRSGVLPLYFSRPLRPADYPGAKFAALAAAVFLLLGSGQLVIFAGAAFGSDKLSTLWPEALDLLAGLAYTLMWALLFAGIGLLVASLTGKRAFAAGGIVAVFLMTGPVVAALQVLPSPVVRDLAGIASPMFMLNGLASWLWPADSSNDVPIGDQGPWYAVAAVLTVALSVSLLLLRYRKVASA